MPVDSLDDLPADSRSQLVADVRSLLGVEVSEAEDIIRSTEPLWDALERAGGLVDSWGGLEFTSLLPRVLSLIRDVGDGVDTTTGATEPVIQIGAILGDSDRESRTWGELIGTISQRVCKAQGGQSSPLKLQVVFHVDGRLAPNTFTGIRTGRYRAEGHWLSVQAAVPLTGIADKETFLLESLTECVTTAEKYARRKKIAKDLPELRAALKHARAAPNPR